MVANGRTPAVPLAAVQAYLDNRLFGALPFAGGTFDQPDDLLSEMRVVAAAVARKQADDQRKAERDLKKKHKTPRRQR